MFIGHYAVAFSIKKFTSNISLGLLFLLVQLSDLLLSIFLFFGLEHIRIIPNATKFTPIDFYDYPLSHSLLSVTIISLIFGIIYFLKTKIIKDFFLIFCAIFSPWILDALVHKPDLPIIPGNSLKVGLGLWNSIPGTIIVELGLFIIGVIIYIKNTRAKDKIGIINLWLLIGLLLIIWISNIFGPPPPNENAIAFVNSGMILFAIWAYKIDKHYERIK